MTITFPVTIVGAGPVGLALALGLARHGIRSVLLERKASPSSTSKAAGIHVRTMELLQQWGVADEFRARGELRQVLSLHSAQAHDRVLYELDFRELSDEAHLPGLLVLEQSETERLLLRAVQRTGLCDVRFGAEAVHLAQDAAGARVMAVAGSDSYAVRSELVVGCDGAGSFVREALGLPFEGGTYALAPLLADVELRDERDELPWPRLWNGARALKFSLRLRPGLWRIVSLDRRAPTRDEKPGEDEVRTALHELLGAGEAHIVWSSRFRIHVRSAPRFRVGRVLLAGDAAHVHSPAWGFGMNGGIQDAHNLAWKIAYALRGGDVSRLLRSYEVERRAIIVETVSRYTDVLTRVFLDSPRIARSAAFAVLRLLLRVGPVRHAALRRGAMLDLDYTSSPLLHDHLLAAGRRLPNLPLIAPDGRAVRLYDRLPCAPVLLEVGDEAHAAGPPLPWARRLPIGSGGHDDPTGRLRDLLQGRDGWILVRPDAHIAWAMHEPRELARHARTALGLQKDRKASERMTTGGRRRRRSTAPL